MASRSAPAPIVIRRYSRLFDAAAGRYVTVDALRAWQEKSIAFIVVDVETGEDVTRALLA